MHCLVQAREPVQFGEHGLDTLGTGLKHDHKILRRRRVVESRPSSHLA